MAKHEIINKEKNKVSEIDLEDSVFDAPVKKPLLHETVVMQLANKRAGTASTKTRAEVAGSNRKPYKQKGTGRARHGTYSSPIFVGGGITFGPKPRDYSYKMPKKTKRQAICSALTMKRKENKLMIIDKLEISSPKTKEFKSILDNLGIKSTLVVLGEKNETLKLSLRNLPHVKAVLGNSINVYDILKHEYLLMTPQSIKSVQEVFAK